ncbi:MAG: hypothetical protein WKF91_14480, partial [Segetibacter sp.]
VIVEFEFNGVTCLVSKDTNLDWLYRDYSNSWIMEWKEVGFNCVEKYSIEVQLEFDKRTKEAEEKRVIQEAEYKAKEDKERLAFIEKTKDVKMEFKTLSNFGLVLHSNSDWELGKEKNTDSYGACIYEYAEGWAKLMQVEILEGKKVEDVAEKTSHEMGFLGITGFMYGSAVSILSQCWKHGERLRKWHNKKYGVDEDKKGVVNPAVLTLSV